MTEWMDEIQQLTESEYMDKFKELDRKIAEHCNNKEKHQQAFISVADLKEIIGSIKNAERLALSNHELNSEVLNLLLVLNSEVKAIKSALIQLLEGDK